MADAQLRIPIVFWQNSVTGQLLMGAPQQFPAPPYHVKIVCHTAHEAERYSRTMREQEASREAMEDEQREQIEGEMLRNLRSHMHSQMANARNAMNRDFLRIFLERQEKQVNKNRTVRTSYLHSEGYEAGH
jgi:hypothetical protein